LESDLPVSRRKEQELAKHYVWEAYWGAQWTGIETQEKQIEGNPNLHSAREVAGYRVMAIDGEIGHVDDFIMDDEAWENGPWEIRYLAIQAAKRPRLDRFLYALGIRHVGRRVARRSPRASSGSSPNRTPSRP